jgi:hypothetical protein
MTPDMAMFSPLLLLKFTFFTPSDSFGKVLIFDVSPADFLPILVATSKHPARAHVAERQSDLIGRAPLHNPVIFITRRSAALNLNRSATTPAPMTR